MSAPADGTVSFLARCLRARWDPAALADVARAGDTVDWDRLVRLAVADKLAAHLYSVARGRDVLPRGVEETLHKHYLVAGLRNSRLWVALASVLDHLTAAGVPVLVLKGAALAETVYANPAARPMLDFDLLVPPRAAARAHAVLVDLGYVPAAPEPWQGFNRRYRNAAAYRPPAGPGPSFLAGLHWGLLDVPYYERIPLDGWFRRAQSVRIAGTPARIPAPEDHLVYLCAHLVLHHHSDPALYRLYDVAALIHSSHPPSPGPGPWPVALDWDAVAARAANWRLVIPLSATLAQVETLWPGTVPADARATVDRLQPGRSERWVYGRVAERTRNPASDLLVSLATMPGLRRRLRFILEQTFPSPAYMRARYCGRHPARWPLAYLLRAAAGLCYLLSRPALAPASGETSQLPTS